MSNNTYKVKKTGSKIEDLLHKIDVLSKDDIGLDQVDNTSDINKPLSNPQREALNMFLAEAKQYTDKEIAEFDFIKIVSALPKEGLPNRIYLVPKTETEEQNLFDEYLWVNNSWEWIATKTIDVDLIDVYTKKEVDERDERLKYYGDPDIVPTDDSFFKFTTDDETMTAVAQVLYNKEIEELVIPYEYVVGDKVYTIIQLTYIDTAVSYWNKSSVKKVIIPNADILDIGDMVFSDTSTTSIDIPECVSYLSGQTFTNCSDLTNITLSENISNISHMAFNGCDNLTITCVEGSYADGYAQIHNIPVEYTKVSKQFILDSRKPDIVKEVVDTLILEDNQDAQLGEISSLVLAMPENIDFTYHSSFNFKSGEIPTNLTYTDTPIIWCGDDCDEDGDFVPESNVVYEVSVKNLGANGIVARVYSNTNAIGDIEAKTNSYTTPEAFGAVGDGITDDTQAFIDAMAEYDVIVGTKEKSYYIHDLEVKGKIIRNCTFSTTTRYTQTAILLGSDSLLYKNVFMGYDKCICSSGGTISSRIIGNSFSSYNHFGIYLGSGYFHNVEICNNYMCNIGLIGQEGSGTSSELSPSDPTQRGVGIYLLNAFNGVHIHDNVFEYCSYSAIQVQHKNNQSYGLISIHDNYFEGNRQCDIHIDHLSRSITLDIYSNFSGRENNNYKGMIFGNAWASDGRVCDRNGEIKWSVPEILTNGSKTLTSEIISKAGRLFYWHSAPTPKKIAIDYEFKSTESTNPLKYQYYSPSENSYKDVFTFKEGRHIEVIKSSDLNDNRVTRGLNENEELIIHSMTSAEALDNKVDKVEGKDLSSNDFTDEEKNKLNNVTDFIIALQNGIMEQQKEILGGNII